MRFVFELTIVWVGQCLEIFMNSDYTTASELVASVKTLLTLPDIYLRVKAVVEDPDSYLDDLVNAISVDPGITARLLRLVNSAYLNLAVRVDNVRRAVNILGMQPMHDLVLATTVTRTFSALDNSSMDMRAFWVLSVCRAVYARLVAGRCNVLDRERLFVEGLLSDIGHQVMYLQLPEQSQAALQRAMENDEALASVEIDMLGLNYADVGGELMRAWEMSERLVDSVQYHVYPERAKKFAMDASIVHIASALARVHDMKVEPDFLLSAVAPTAWQITGLTPEELVPLRDEAVIEMEEAIGMLLVSDAA
jgi:HD-like signal output (HDOD) protein